MQPDWIVRKWGYSKWGMVWFKSGFKPGRKPPYPYWVLGTHLNDNSEFFWVVPDIDNKRFDLSNAVYGTLDKLGG
jgi:hypothetical protein